MFVFAYVCACPCVGGIGNTLPVAPTTQAWDIGGWDLPRPERGPLAGFDPNTGNSTSRFSGEDSGAKRSMKRCK